MISSVKEELRFKKINTNTFFYWFPHKSIYGYVNNSGKLILELLNKKLTEQEIVNHYSKIYNIPKKTAENDFQNFIELVKEKGVFKEKKEVMKIFGKESYKITLNITNNCNLRCKHCYLESGKGYENIPAKDIFNVIDEISANLEVADLIITGGEVTTRSDVYDIVEYIASKKFRHVQFLTNGIKLTEKEIKFLEPRVSLIQVSLDGPNEATHEYIRGKGTFKKSISTLKKIRKYFPSERIVISVTPMKPNLPYIEDFVRLAIKLDVGHLHIPTFIHVGRGNENTEILQPTLKETLKYFEELFQLSKPGNIGEKVLSAWRKTNFQDYFARLVPDNNYLSCGFGQSVITITHDGKVNPCAWLYQDEYSLGNIKNIKLSDLHNNKKLISLHKINKKRIHNNKACKNCFYNLACQSGCMGIAKIMTGKLENRTDIICGMARYLINKLITEGFYESSLYSSGAEDDKSKHKHN